MRRTRSSRGFLPATILVAASRRRADRAGLALLTTRRRFCVRRFGAREIRRRARDFVATRFATRRDRRDRAVEARALPRRLALFLAIIQVLVQNLPASRDRRIRERGT